MTSEFASDELQNLEDVSGKKVWVRIRNCPRERSIAPTKVAHGAAITYDVGRRAVTMVVRPSGEKQFVSDEWVGITYPAWQDR